MYIYGPSTTENIPFEQNDYLSVILEKFNNSSDKQKTIQKTKKHIESRIKLAKYSK